MTVVRDNFREFASRPVLVGGNPSVHQYRADIDGLRAIAVLAVVIYHAFPNLVRGGFAGVDVFFVISGFLISSILLGDLNTGNFTFAGFYARRIRRIFPALMFVLLACLSFGWIALLADEYAQLGRHTAAGAGFVSNLVLWGEAGYFDNSADTKPLLHLWSLGVEEQFYIVWPAMLVFAWKSGGRLWKYVAAAAAVSFVLNLWMVVYSTDADFYWPLSRFWELLCGALLAILFIEGGSKEVGPAWANTASIAGLGFLGYSFIFIDRNMLYPGALAMLPVTGAVLFIFAGPAAAINRLILAHPLMIRLGLISYPLYLWHWPLLSFLRIVGSVHTASAAKIEALIGALVLAWLTYLLIEHPIRSRKLSKAAIAVLVSLMACIGMAGFAIDRYDGLKSRAAVAINAAMAAPLGDGGDGGWLTGACGLSPEESRLFGVCGSDSRGHVSYALLGDSKARSLYPGLIRTSSESGRWRVISSIVPIMTSEPEYAHYQSQASIAIKAISEDPGVKHVVFAVSMRAIFRLDDGVRGADHSLYDYGYLAQLNRSGKFDKARAGLKAAISRLAAAGKKVTILVDNPPLPEPRDCVERKTSSAELNKLFGLESRVDSRDCFLPLARFEEEIVLYRKLLSALHDDLPSIVDIFDATDIYCDMKSAVCGPTHNDHFLYSYTDHISDYAAGLVGAKLNAHLNEHFSSEPGESAQARSN